MKNKILILPILALLTIFSSCETYPDWKEYVEYSDTYPISGDWYVEDFYTDVAGNDSVIGPYALYIYNKSYNPSKDSIWIDNATGHPTGGAVYDSKFKIKCRTDLTALSFDCTNQGNITGSNLDPVPNAFTVTISDSKVVDHDPDDIESAKADEISFKVVITDGVTGEILKEYVTKGHRKTGWEEPNYSDDM